MIQRKRIYEEASADDGKRVLVDRVWPRGVSKEKAQLDEWLKDVSPSPDLRKWFGHQPERFEAFREAYQKELADIPERQESVAKLQEWSAEGTVTLVFAAKDQTHNHVIVLQDFIDRLD